MNDQHILASPNWYYSGISDISLDGIFAYGGKNTVFLFDLAGAESSQYFGQLCGHKDRVTSVSFCKTSTYSRCCASASEDLSVVIWDIDAKEVIAKHNTHQSRASVVCWSQASNDWIFSGDDKGHVISWNYQQNEIYKYVPVTGQINCILCAPDEENFLVIGYKTGQIIVLSLNKEKYEIVNVLKGHNDEIHSLVWSPVPVSELPTEIFGVANRQETGYILASGSRDKTIRLWDVSVGQFIAVVHVPNRSSNRKTSRDDYHMKSRLWNTLCWPASDPNSLVSSGFSGDILTWNLSRNSKQKWQLFSEGQHSRIVFTICHYASNDVMASVSMDRLINIWNRRDATLITSLPSFGGFVYSLDVSVLDPSCLAVGVGDNMIRIWDTMAHGPSYGLTTLWRGIGTKVMKVLWHPMKEGTLAFGTEEGKVGIYNVLSQTCNVSRTYHKKSVYSLSWGPPTAAAESGGGDVDMWHLYSCGGEGGILEHKPENLHDEAKNVDRLIKTTNDIKHNLAGHSEVSWKPDRSVMAVGNEDGSIKFYRCPDLKLLSTVNVHNKSITCLAWCRSHDSNDPGSAFLASGSNSYEVHVHDLKHIIDGGDQKVITSSYRVLSGHSGRITDVVWSPHSFSKLASSSYDGTVEVWDAVTGEPLANYRDHSGRVMTVAWSLMDPDVLFSGSDDFTVRSWRISQQLFKVPPLEVKKPTKSKNKKKKPKTAAACQKAEDKNAVCEPVVSLEEKPSVGIETVRDEKAPVENSEDLHRPLENAKNYETFHEKSHQFSEQRTGDSRTEEPHVATKGDSKKKKKKWKSMFPLSASADNKTRSITSQQCVDIANFFTKDGVEEALDITADNVNIGLFVDRKSAFNMLSEEGIHHAESGNIDYQLQLEIWKGNIGKALEIAVEKRQLCDWLVAISHLAGEQVRLAVTEAFAEQLVNQGNHHRAALYYLACHKVYDAIRMFETSGMYREAIALAKVRLLPSDPVLLNLYSSWGRKLESEYTFELASKCYLACGLHDDAIRVLTRRDDDISVHSAAQIAKSCSKTELSQSLIQRCALMAMKKAKWNDALKMVRDYPDMQPFLMLMFVHKTILGSLVKSEAVKYEEFPEIQFSADTHNVKPASNLPKFVQQLKAQYGTRSSDSTSQWGSPTDDHYSYSVCTILETWWSDCGLHVHETRLPEFYDQISTFGITKHSSNKDDIRNILMIISRNICLGLAAALHAKHDVCMQHFLRAIIHCHDTGYNKILCHLFPLLFPFGVESCYMLKCLGEFNTESATSSKSEQYFFNVVAFYHRAMLAECLASQKLRGIEGQDIEESRQNSLGEESCPPINAPWNKLVNAEASTSCEEQTYEISELSQSGECAFKNLSIHCQAMSKTDFGSGKTTDFAEEENSCGEPDGKLKERAFKDVYRVALVCSTVLLSDIHAEFQKVNGKYDDDDEYTKDKDDSRGKTEGKISLSKIPFPNVVESACMLVDLLKCTISSKDTLDVEKETALDLSRQISNWAAARECNKEQ